MYLELIDALRCPVPHEESPLIAAISRRADRDIVSGALGCPVCRAEYAIQNGVAIFAEEAVPTSARSAGPEESAEETALRCAAMLDLHDPGGIVLLAGAWGLGAAALLEMTRVLVLLVDPPQGLQLGNGLAALRIGDALPLARGAVRGIALDDARSTPALLASAGRALKSGGRLVASARAALPTGLVERARDDRCWVADAAGPASAPVQLSRSRDPAAP